MHTTFLRKLGVYLTQNHNTVSMKNERLKTIKKEFLPQKDCLVCGKPFSWRKKWDKVWNEVKYCSDKCRKIKQ